MSGRSAVPRGSTSAPGRRRRERGGTSFPRRPGSQRGAPAGRSTTPAPRPAANPARRQGDRPTGRFQRSRAAARARAPRSCAASAPPARRHAAHSRAVGAAGFHGRRPSAGRRWNRSDQARRSGAHVAMSASTHVAAMPLRLARASMSLELSIPMTVAAGQRSTNKRVELPGPQPRSTTRSASATARAPAGRSPAAYGGRRKRDNAARSRSHIGSADTHFRHPATQSVSAAALRNRTERGSLPPKGIRRTAVPPRTFDAPVAHEALAHTTVSTWPLRRRCSSRSSLPTCGSCTPSRASRFAKRALPLSEPGVG